MPIRLLKTYKEFLTKAAIGLDGEKRRDVESRRRLSVGGRRCRCDTCVDMVCPPADAPPIIPGQRRTTGICTCQRGAELAGILCSGQMRSGSAHKNGARKHPGPVLMQIKLRPMGVSFSCDGSAPVHQDRATQSSRAPERQQCRSCSGHRRWSHRSVRTD